MAFSTREVFLVLRARDEASRVLRDFSKNLNKVDEATMRAAQAQMARGSAMSSIGVGLVAAGTAAAAFFKTSVDSAVEYTRQAALTKTQTDKVVVSIEQLKDIGREVGSTIPTDFDKIQTSLYDIFSSIDVNLPQAKKLLKEFAMESVAGQEDLQEAGKGTVGILNAFKIPISQVRTVSDTMFQLVRKGVGTYQQFNRTIGRAVPSAARAGQSFQSLAGMMAFLTRNGISAAMASASAGRALDAISNQKVVGKLEKMGITVRDAAGEFMPMNKIMTQLGEKMKDMTGPERAAALNDLFKGAGGTIQARRFFDLAVKNYAQLNQYTDAMVNSKGAMQEAYDTMFKQPQSQAVLLANNMKILKTIVGDALTPAWLKMTGAIIKVVKWFNNLDPHTRTLVIKITALAAVLTILVGGVLAVTGAILMFGAALAMAQVALLPLIGVVALVVAGLVALGVGIFLIVKYHKQIWAFMKKTWTQVVQLFEVVKQALIDNLSGPLQDVIDWAKMAGKAIADFAVMAAEYISGKLGGPIKQIGGWFADAGAAISRTAREVFKNLSDAWAKVAPILVDGFKNAWEGVKPVLAAIWSALGKGADLFWKGVKPALDAFGKAWPTIRMLLDKSVNTIVSILMGMAKVIRFVAEFVGKRLLGALILLSQIIKFVAPVIGKFLVTALYIAVAGFKMLGAIVSRVIPPILQMIGRVIGNIINILRGLVIFILGVFTGDWGKAWLGIKIIVGNIFQAIWNIIKGVGKTIAALFVGFVKGIVAAAKWLWDKLVGHSIFPDIAKGIIYWFTYIWKIGPKIFGYLVAGIVALSKKLIDTIVALAKKMPTPFIKAGTWLLQAGKNFVKGLMDGIWNLASGIARWAYDKVISPLVAVFTNKKNGASTWLLQAGKNVIAGFRDGMKAIWADVTKWVAGIATWIKDHKGPVALDGKLLIPAGKAIMSGFLTGLKKGAGPAWDFVKRVGGKSVDALWSLIQGPNAGKPGAFPAGAGRFNVNGEILDAGTYTLLTQAEKMLGGLFRVMQGSFSTRVAASGSTHAGGGAMDVVPPPGVSWDAAVAILRKVGFAAWHRTPAQGPWGHHIHAIAIGDPLLSAAARGQVADYLRGGDGLAGYAKGAWKILNNQMAYLHRGEMIVPSAPAESIRRGYNGDATNGAPNIPISIYTQEIDPVKHAADLGWEIARRVG